MRHSCRTRSLHPVAIALSLLLSFHTVSIHAEVPSTKEWIKAGTISTASIALSLGLRFVPTPECYWCSTNSFDETIARSWEGSNLRAARITSDVLTFGAVPLVALASVLMFAPNIDEMLRDALVIVSSAAATSAITELLKISARRKRPEAAFGYSIGQSQDNRSFLSGHTSFSFSILTSASVLAFKRGSRLAPLFATVSALLSAGAGISRIVAAKHWATDVVAGMVLGVGVGIAMPFLILDTHNAEKTAHFYAVPDPAIYGLQIGWSF